MTSLSFSFILLGPRDLELMTMNVQRLKSFSHLNEESPYLAMVKVSLCKDEYFIGCSEVWDEFPTGL
jgi:hypothetical protein